MSLSCEDALERGQAVVLDVRVGADDAGAGPREQLAQLVAERGPGVVRLGLEGHPEDADRLALQRPVAALEGADDVRGQALVDLHRGLAHREVVARERGQLHRVLEQARTGGEARARQVRGARVVLADRAQDVGVVHAGLVGDHEELVRDRELHVAPRVREELGELGLLARSSGSSCDADAREQRRRRARPATSSSAPMICGSECSSSRAWPSAIRSGQKATSTVQPASARCWATYAVVPGIDRAAQDDERAVAEVRGDLVRRPSRRSSSMGRGTRRPGSR